MQTTEMEFTIPLESGEVFCHPDVHEFENVARENADLLSGSQLRIGDTPLAALRRLARARVLQMSAAFTARLQVDLPSPPTNALLLATGHQPFLFHPGIWIKQLLVGRLAGEGIGAVSIPVDSDAFEEIGADVPVLDGGLRKIRETLVRAAPEVPYEAQPAPPLTLWQEFLGRIAAALRTLNEPEIEAAFEQFVQAAAGVSHVDDIGTFLTLVRRRHEGLRRYLEVPASHVSRTPEFRRLFLAIMRDGPRFAETYNRHLDAYRERHNVRTAAQPFPNLELEASRVELPFWVVSGGKRHSIYAERRDRNWIIGTRDDMSLVFSDTDGPEELERVEIRPKALTLTAFIRLCVADLFVHGVGGGRYDRVTDAVITDYFGIRPPRYAVVTATLHLPLHEHNTDSERQRLQRRVLEIQHNPERVIASPSLEQQRVIDEKWVLIRSLDSSAITRRERRQITQRIREINDHLSQDLKGERAEADLRLQSLGDALDADAAARHRGYPLFFFPPQSIDALIDKLGV